MKKIAFSLIALAFVLSSSTSFAAGIRLGLTGSGAASWYKSETVNYESEGIRPGFSYGLIYESILAENYTFATGLNIVYFGGRMTFPIDNPEFEFRDRTYRLQSVEIPMTFKMKTREIGYNSYFARFGFGGSININAKANDRLFNPNDSKVLLTNDLDIKSTVPLFRASMIVGLGVEHSLGGTTVLVGGLNFNNGFTNAMKGRDFSGQRVQKARINYLELTVGIIF